MDLYQLVDDMKCEYKRQLTLMGVLFSIYSLMGAVCEHFNTNLHYPMMTALDPVRYPVRTKVQHNPILTGFPFWGIAGLAVWQLDNLFKSLFFQNSKSPIPKLIFDFFVWAGIATAGEYFYGMHLGGAKGYTKEGLLYSYDYSYMKYNYKGVISLPTSITFGFMAVAFIRLNPYLIDFVNKGINGSICPSEREKKFEQLN